MIGNGDIFTPDQAIEKQKLSHTDGVMIGRGALGNPWLFRQIKEAAAGKTIHTVTCQERHDMIIRHYQMMLECKPEPIAVREMRKHIGWYIKGIRGASRFRAEINRCGNAKKAMELTDFLFEEVYNSTDSETQEDGV